VGEATTSFEDSSLMRKVNLLHHLATTQFEKCDSIDEYINEIVISAHKLSGLGFRESQTSGLEQLLLTDLPDQYRTIIMGIRNGNNCRHH